jgi:hypothetical protein
MKKYLSLKDNAFKANYQSNLLFTKIEERLA